MKRGCAPSYLQHEDRLDFELRATRKARYADGRARRKGLRYHLGHDRIRFAEARQVGEEQRELDGVGKLTDARTRNRIQVLERLPHLRPRQRLGHVQR